VKLDHIDVDRRFDAIVQALERAHPPDGPSAAREVSPVAGGPSHLWSMRAAAAIVCGVGLALTPTVSRLTGTHPFGLVLLAVVWSSTILALALGVVLLVGRRSRR
jgi:hypothetical protein